MFLWQSHEYHVLDSDFQKSNPAQKRQNSATPPEFPTEIFVERQNSATSRAKPSSSTWYRSTGHHLYHTKMYSTLVHNLVVHNMTYDIQYECMNTRRTRINLWVDHNNGNSKKVAPSFHPSITPSLHFTSTTIRWESNEAWVLQFRGLDCFRRASFEWFKSRHTPARCW